MGVIGPKTTAAICRIMASHSRQCFPKMGWSGATLDSPDMPCCRRSDLTALERGPKSWSWTIKGCATPPALRATPCYTQNSLFCLSEKKSKTFVSLPRNSFVIQSGPEMSSIIRISDGFLGSFSHSQKFHRVHAVFDEVAMEALKFGPSSQRPCLG